MPDQLALPTTFGGLAAAIQLALLDGNYLALVRGLPVGVNNFRLILSGGNLTLQPVNGCSVDINGTVYAYTSMPTLAPGTFSASTLYYVYLTDVSGVATLEGSTTGYTVDTKGRAYKTGDATRRLMGLARTTAGVAWADTSAQRFVLSRDNRRDIGASNYFAANRSTASNAWAELSSSERIEFLTWAEEAITLDAHGSAYSDAGAGNNVSTSIGLDGTSPLDFYWVWNNAAPNLGQAFGGMETWGPAEGYHYATILGKVSAGTGTWYGNASPGGRCMISARIRG